MMKKEYSITGFKALIVAAIFIAAIAVIGILIGQSINEKEFIAFMNTPITDMTYGQVIGGIVFVWVLFTK